VNYNLQGALGQTGHVKINIIDGGVLINGSNLLVKENLSKVLKSCLLGLAMPHNSPAIKLESVTRPACRQAGASRPECSIPESGDKVSEAGEGGYGRFFAILVQSFLELYMFRGTRLIESRIMSPYCYFINSTCG
jgi:hypothetical protein